MRLVLRFLVRTLIWTSGFLALVVLSAVLSGESGDTPILHVTPWRLAGALIFATFPAGISVAREVISWSRPRLGPPVAITLAAGLVALLVVLVRGYAGPALVRGGEAPEAAAAAEVEAASLYFHERPRALRQAVSALEAAGETSVDAWVPVNRIAWEMDGTVVSGLLAMAFAWIGVLLGAWSRWAHRRELRQLQYWALGLFLLMTTYLMGENSYELLLLRMAGPAFFAAWLPLIAPAMLLFGLTMATVARLLGASVEPE